MTEALLPHLLWLRALAGFIGNAKQRHSPVNLERALLHLWQKTFISFIQFQHLLCHEIIVAATYIDLLFCRRQQKLLFKLNPNKPCR